MRSYKTKASSPTNTSADDRSAAFFQGQAESADSDLMCLVYPDGSVTTIATSSAPNPKKSNQSH